MPNNLSYFLTKWNIDPNQPSPINVPIGRHKDIPRTFAEMGFTKGAEIGVYRGEYSEILLSHIPNLHLIGVDLWDSYQGFIDYSKEKLRDAYNYALENTKDYNCKLIKGYSDEIAKTIPDESLDFVYIDANHAYEYVVADIANWSKKVKSGGVVYGDDYSDLSNRKSWKEVNVINAVQGWMKSYKIEPWFILSKKNRVNWLYFKE